MNAATEEDLVRRQFTAEAPDRLWLTDITEHPAADGKLYCAAVMDAYSRRIIGWSIDKRQDTDLVVSALAMAVTRRQPGVGALRACRGRAAVAGYRAATVSVWHARAVGAVKRRRAARARSRITATVAAMTAAATAMSTICQTGMLPVTMVC